MDIAKIRSDKVQDAQIKDLQKSEKSGTTAAVVKTGVVPNSEGLTQKVSSENVKFSDNAGLFAEALQTAKNAPNVRPDRVAELKASIKNGTYKVDSHAVAEKMLKSAVDEHRKT